MFTCRPATEADFPLVVALINAQTGDHMTVEQYTANARSVPPEMDSRKVVAFLPDGRFAGYGYAGEDEERPAGHFFIAIRVDAACRGQGVGNELLQMLTRWARSCGAIRLEATLPEEQSEARAWAERRGFVTEGLVTKSELKLDGWEPGPFLGVLTAAAARGICFITLAAAGATEENLRRLYGLCKALEHDVPGRGPLLPSYQSWRAKIEADPAWDPACILLAVDGAEWVAASFFEKQADGSWYTHLTGVLPERRGKGLGTAVKVAAVRLARECGVPYISTYNHDVNVPMLAINRQLGYEPFKTLVQMYLPL